MARTNESNLKLGDLFAKKVFRIPMYQRGYAWGDKQLDDLWDDIMDIEKDDNGEFRRHYTGMISLKEIPRNEIPHEELWLKDRGFSFFDVVDGQQRLTTIILLIFELARAFHASDPETEKELLNSFIFAERSTFKTYFFAYNSQDKNRAFLINRIFEDPSTVICSNTLNIYTKNLENAKEYFQKHISALEADELNDLLNKLRNALAFDTKYIDDDLSVQAVFETMNNRGKQLTILEKLKNRLLFLAARLPNQPDEIKVLSNKINDAWRIIYDYLGQNPDLVLDEDEFLSAHLTLIRRPADYSFSESVAEKKVFEMFCNRAEKYLLSYSRDQGENAEHEPKVDYDKINSYILDISKCAQFWYEAVNSSNLKIIKILCLNSSKEMRIFLSELLAHKESFPIEVETCINLVYRIVFRDNIPGLSIGDERAFATRARELHAKEKTIKELENELSEKLNDPCNVNTVINEFRRWFGMYRRPYGFHRWWALKFFLMEYEQYLHETYYDQDIAHMEWKNYSDVNIEHILPQNFAKNWSDIMKDYVEGRELDVDSLRKAQNILVNTLGNLTIIRDKKNSSLQDDAWLDKRERYKSGSFSELEISSKKEGKDFEHEEWNQDTIYERGCNMVHFMERKVQGLKFEEHEIKELLFDRELFYPKSIQAKIDNVQEGIVDTTL